MPAPISPDVTRAATSGSSRMQASACAPSAKGRTS